LEVGIIVQKMFNWIL